MSRLKSRQHYPPCGFQLYQPETKFQGPRGQSFDTVVNAFIAHRQGNPSLKNYSTDYDTVANEVDSFTAAICERMGWHNFIQSGGGAVSVVPFSPSPPPAPVIDPSKLSAAVSGIKKIWAGARTLDDWLDSGEPAVPSDLSTSRAEICSRCTRNTPGDFTTWFTKPAAEVIRRQIERLQERKLSTPHDEKLNVCDVCLCPMKLKVHTPMKFINARMAADVKAELLAVPECWVPREPEVS